jgi:hypothetical protein
VLGTSPNGRGSPALPSRGPCNMCRSNGLGREDFSREGRRPGSLMEGSVGRKDVVRRAIVMGRVKRRFRAYK